MIAATDLIRLIADSANASMYPATDQRSFVPLATIKSVLEDGQALAALGADDDDQEAVEDAHETVCSWMIGGLAYYHDAA